MGALNTNHLQRIARWGRFLGIITIIFGAISALIGLFDLIIGAIPGIISIIIGYLIFQTGQAAKQVAHASEFDMASLNELLNKYGKVLLISGIMTIVLLGLLVLLLLLFIVIGVIAL